MLADNRRLRARGVMKEHPILFGGAMVRAILSGKTQTRRPVTHQNTNVNGYGFVSKATFARYPLDKAWVNHGPSLAGNPGPFLKCDSTHPDDDGAMARLYAPWSVGDVLWVRENAYIAPPGFGDVDACNAVDSEGRRRFVGYAASMDGDSVRCAKDYGVKQTPSIHLPRWAARLFLRVTAIRCERIQDITEEDAVAEGTREPSVAQVIGGGDVTERRVFARLWSATYGASSWERNEWVWALTFERCADPSPRAGKVAP